MKTNWKAVVTGASRGLGAALSEALAARGIEVALVARSADALNEVVTRIRKNGGRAHAIVADVADKDATYRIAGEAMAAMGSVDLLVHNASALGPTPLQLLLDTDCEDLEAVLQTNVVGAFRLTRALVGPMVLRGSGVVVQISSDAAVQPYERWGLYGASKAAGDQLTRILAAEVKASGVRVITFDPGEMDTQMHAEAMPEADPSMLARPSDVAARLIRELFE
ncbi:MAG: short-chain dehydrogenase [Archangium gephyra]|uniref:Short-chain dehydrogenase n=1 Tax=Archangium gephyra TaxID=48 RepID=A0A2W5V304_9BACT|nr:MAG: short-chain dehydrogenase [Archangium gephyra]